MLSIKCNRKSVQPVLERAAHVAARKSTMDVLSCVRLTAEDSKLSIVATDLTVSLTASCDVEVMAPGTVVVNAQALLDRVRALPGDEFTLQEVEVHSVQIRCGKRQYKLPARDITEFPSIAEPQDGMPVVRVKSDALKGCLEAVAHAASTDTSRIQLCSVKVEFGSGKITCAATDGNRCAVCTAESPTAREVNAIVPLRGVQEIRTLLGDGGDAEVVDTGREIFVTVGSYRLSTKLVDSQFPPYQELVSLCRGSVTKSITFPCETIVSTLKGVSLATDKIDGLDTGVGLTMTSGLLRIEARSGEYGESCDELDVDYSGPDTAHRASWRYLVDSLTACGVDEVTVKLGGELDGIVIQSSAEDDKSDFVAVVMPMRL